MRRCYGVCVSGRARRAVRRRRRWGGVGAQKCALRADLQLPWAYLLAPQGEDSTAQTCIPRLSMAVTRAETS